MPRGPVAERGQLGRPGGTPRLRGDRPQGRPPREVHRAGRPARPQRGPLLPRPDRPHRGAAPHCLHADGRPRLRGLQPHLPPASTRLDHARPPGTRRDGAGERPAQRRPADRRDRQRAHPRPGRPGRGRHADPHRQARPLHHRRRNPREGTAGSPLRGINPTDARALSLTPWTCSRTGRPSGPWSGRSARWHSIRTT